MKKWLVSFIVLTINIVYGQTVYVDPATSGAMLAYSGILKDGQDDIKEEQSKLKEFQALVGLGVNRLEQTQQKLLKGFQEVNTTITNGIQVVNISKEIVRIYQVAEDLTELIGDYPEYAVFGIKATEQAYQHAIEIGAEVTSIIQNTDGKNLMSAGDRLRILEKIYHKVSHFRFLLQVIEYNIRYAIRLGWWRAINPFQGYINTDKNIIENIMVRYKYIF